MKKWRLILALLCGVLLVAGFLVSLAPEALAQSLPKTPWFWKAGWHDYAPSGVPDFDQKQVFMLQPLPPWTYCGPVAAANSLWWFDSKFEPVLIPPPALNNNYFLINSYLPWVGFDDHDPVNVGGLLGPGLPAPIGAIPPPGLVDDLAFYFNANMQRGGPAPSELPWTGTRVKDMFEGLNWWLYGGNPLWGPGPAGPRPGSYYDNYYAMMVKAPDWNWIVDEVKRSEDVLLLLGFYQENLPASGYFERVGGHFVTVAGVDPAANMIGLSDPYYDWQESLPGPGEILSGTIPGYRHTIPGHAGFIHNDAGNVSHDAYLVNRIIPPPFAMQAIWELTGYPYDPRIDPTFLGQNTPVGMGNMPVSPFSPRTFIEYAVAVSPFDWKPGGEWVHSYYNEEWIWEWWSFEDDGDSCVPDFKWSGSSGIPEAAYDGPTALANSLWWFDSKAETLVTGGFAVPPPTISDHYPLVSSSDIASWDDHAYTNTLPLIDNLADVLNTGALGTTKEQMAAGIQDYLEQTGTDGDFYTKTQSAPSFDWVADEVLACEDVVMLLGFYELSPTGSWERKSGHWVDAAGVSKENQQIGLSDPRKDRSNVQSFFDVVYPGRVFPPEHLGEPFTDKEKLMPQSISHDIYFAAHSPLPPYQWTLADYPAEDLLTGAIGMNGGGTDWTGHPITTVVEWAIGVSPYADLVITKTASLTEVKASQPITYVIEYANTGLASVSNVAINDLPPLSVLSNLTYVTVPPLTPGAGIGLNWTIPKLSFGQGGVITITATVNDPPLGGVYTNTATISVPSAERSPTNNSSQAAFLIRYPVYLPVVSKK